MERVMKLFKGQKGDWSALMNHTLSSNPKCSHRIIFNIELTEGLICKINTNTPNREISEANATLIASALDGLKVHVDLYLFLQWHSRRSVAFSMACAQQRIDLRNHISRATGRSGEEIQTFIESETRDVSFSTFPISDGSDPE